MCINTSLNILVFYYIIILMEMAVENKSWVQINTEGFLKEGQWWSQITWINAIGLKSFKLVL